MQIRDPLQCKDRCGAVVADEDAAGQAGWTWLAVAGGWRCPACVRVLLDASTLPGAPAGEFVDVLPPDSRGALPKETAPTITAPVVKP